MIITLNQFSSNSIFPVTQLTSIVQGCEKEEGINELMKNNKVNLKTIEIMRKEWNTIPSCIPSSQLRFPTIHPHYHLSTVLHLYQEVSHPYIFQDFNRIGS